VSNCLKLITAVSLAIASLTAVAQRPVWGHPRPPKAGACFYKDAGFGGNYFCLKIGDRWPSMPPGFNDKISSIRVFNGAVVRVFADNEFQGNSLHVDRDVESLGNIRLRRAPSRSWNDRISSIAVVRDRDQWDQGHPY
jgi:hypothetical protein